MRVIPRASLQFERRFEREKSDRSDCNCTSVLETLPTEYRLMLNGDKRDSRLRATFRAENLGFTDIP